MSADRSPSTAIARGAVASISAAVLFAFSTVLVQIAPVSQTYDSTSSYINSVIVALAFIAAAVGLVGINAAHHGDSKFGRLGALGGWVAIAGCVIVALHTVYAMIVGDGQSAVVVRIGAAVALAIGSIVLGILALRARVLPWWCGVLLIVAFPFGDIAEAAVAGLEGLLLALLWGSVGAALLRLRSASTSAQRIPADAHGSN
jgi:hypothetical protein